MNPATGPVVITKECHYGDGPERGWLVRYGSRHFIVIATEARELRSAWENTDGSVTWMPLPVPAATWVYPAEGEGDFWQLSPWKPVAGGPNMTFEQAVADLEHKALDALADRVAWINP